MIKTSVSVDLKPEQRLILIPLGDVQLGATEYDSARFTRLIDWIVQQEQKGDIVRIIGMGDYVDPGSPTERAALRSLSVHESTRFALDNAVLKMVGEFVDLMVPVSHCVIGLLTGHHNYQFGGRSADQIICQNLAVPYLGTGTALVRLYLPHDLHLDIFAAHGASNAQTAGGRVQARAKYADVAPGAHLVLVGHDVAKFAYPLSGVDYDQGNVKRYLIGTGSFQRSYQERLIAGYAEAAGLRPADMGVAMVNIVVEERDDRWRVDYHVSV